MTITPRVGVSGIEFIRSREGSEEREIVAVPLDVCRWLMQAGMREYLVSGIEPAEYDMPAVLYILRQEAEK